MEDVGGTRNSQKLTFQCATEQRTGENNKSALNDGRLLAFCGVVVLGLAFTAVGQPTAYHESPVLAEKVAQGELPPVEERLPKHPKILPVYEEIGQYGGTWRRAYTGLADRWGATKLLEEHIVEFYMPQAGKIVTQPNWVDGFEISPDATTYRFHIREGLKWSDGVPVTTDDVRFWYQDVFLNPTLTPSKPEHLTVKGQPLTLDIIDRETFTVQFAAPYPFFPEVLAKIGTLDTRLNLLDTAFVLPFHYLQAFHPTYTAPEALAKAAAERGVNTWLELWGEKGPILSWWLNPALPVLSAWKIKIPAPAPQMVMERNPYYFAVDAAGNQLPYLDEIVHTLVEKPEDMPLLAVQGELDMQDRNFRRADYTFLKRSEAQGDYRVMLWVESSAAVYLNVNTTNAVLAGLFDDVRFRHAMSIAINRQELQEVVFNGLGQISQAGPMSASPHYDPELAVKWIEYDPAAANALLDELGLTQRDADGFRLDATGAALQIAMIYPNYLYGDLIPGLIQSYWQAIGVKTTWALVDRATFEKRVSENAFDGSLYLYGRNLIIPADPGFFLGTVQDGTWMPLWGQWRVQEWRERGTAAGIEPPAEHPIRQAWALWEQAKTAPSRAAANALIQQIVDLHKANVWVIGLVSELPVPVVVKNNLRNVPEFGMVLDEVRGTHIAQPAQFFFKRP